MMAKTGMASALALRPSKVFWPCGWRARFVTIDASALPHAADVARLAAHAYARGEALAPERVEPAYLRNNVALTIAEQQALRDSR